MKALEDGASPDVGRLGQANAADSAELMGLDDGSEQALIAAFNASVWPLVGPSCAYRRAKGERGAVVAPESWQNCGGRG